TPKTMIHIRVEPPSPPRRILKFILRYRLTPSFSFVTSGGLHLRHFTQPPDDSQVTGTVIPHGNLSAVRAALYPVDCAIPVTDRAICVRLLNDIYKRCRAAVRAFRLTGYTPE